MGYGKEWFKGTNNLKYYWTRKRRGEDRRGGTQK